MTKIKREKLLNRINKAFRSHRIVCLLGPRQCGKTTVARQIQKEYESVYYFDFENYSDMQAFDNPVMALNSLRGLIIMDEIQRKPDLFPYLRYLHDQEFDQKFLILGSASRDFIKQSTESLAGRIRYIKVTPFSLDEVNNLEHLWVNGGFPKSYLLEKEESWEWRASYMMTYIERDLAVLGFEYRMDLLTKLWFMLAHYHGQIINYSELSSSLSVGQGVIKKYMSYLEGSFMIRVLKPWYENIAKRQVKSSKIYYRDSGLLHYVLGVHSYLDILKNPKLGASFEGLAIEEVIKFHKVESSRCYFWASHNDTELDLLILNEGKKLGFEVKTSVAPKLTPSMRIAMKDLKLDSLTVIYPTGRSYMLADNIRVISLEEYISEKI